jgi:lipooligosaccharide transport system permease protein
MRWPRKREDELVPAGEERLVGNAPAGAGQRDDAADGRERATLVLQAAEDAADRVAGLLEAAEEAAEQRLAEARAEAAGMRRKAEAEAAAHLRQLLYEAERMRAEADEYVVNMRVAADAYAEQRQAEAEELARKTLDDAEAQAREVEVAAEEEEEEAPPGPAKIRRRVELTAVAAVMSRDISVFLRSWRSTTFSAIVEPIAFLLAFGLGFGALVSSVQGVDYIEFVGTGVVAATVVFSSAFPGMFSTFVKREFNRTYDALLSTPVNVDELVTAEVLWIAIRTGVYATAPVLVAVGFGLRPGWGIVLVPLIALLTAFGLAAFGVTMAAIMKTIANFSYIISGVLTPLVLLAGAYFPINSLPTWAFVADHFNPLYHCVELVRDAVFGLELYNDLGHAGALLLFAAIMWRIAIWRLRPRLID